MKPSVAFSSCSPPSRAGRLSGLLAAVACLLPPIAAHAQVSFNGIQTTRGSNFCEPKGVAVDASGNIFLADTCNNAVREILANSGYTTVKTLGSGFSQPSAVALDASGNVYVADYGNNAVKEILASGGYATVKTLGGGFKHPRGVALDASGDVYVGDYGNNAVKEILAVNGSVPSSPGINLLGSGFVGPAGVAVDGSGDVYIADFGNNKVQEIVAAGGSIPSSSPAILTLGSGFNEPAAVAVDGSGNVYVADSGNDMVQQIVSVGGTIPSSSPTIKSLGSGFSEPSAVAVDGNGDVFVADQGSGKVTELALQSVNMGSEAAGSSGSTFSLPFTIGAAKSTKIGSIAVLTTGIAGLDFGSVAGGSCTAKTYAAATQCVMNVRFSPLAAGSRTGAVVFYSGANETGTVLATTPVYGVGTGAQIAYGPGGAQSKVGSKFISPAGVAVDASGNVYVSDIGLQEVFKITPGGKQSSVGSGLQVPEALAVDGAGNVYIADSQFPAGVAVDGAGNVYVSDPFIVAVFKITPSGAQTTVGGGYNTPVGVAVDAAGNVYVADSFNAAVFKVTPSGTQTTVGNNLTSPAAVAVDAAGDVYISDGGTNAVYEVTPAGVQTTVAGGFDVLDGIAADSSGNLFLADSYLSKAIKIDRADAPSLTFDKTELGATSKDSPRTVEIDNIGNAPLVFSSLSYPADFPMAHPGAGQACTSSTSLAASSGCALAISFSPIAKLSGSKSVVVSEEVKFKTDVLNKPDTQATISVSGTETAQ